SNGTARSASTLHLHQRSRYISVASRWTPLESKRRDTSN
ncbi:hypothetical protein LINGRAHAP2_LOCUS7401, partial [Linum grandiflorum]